MKRGCPLADGPGTMIVLDPDLDPDPASAKAASPSASVSPFNTRIPSARTLARFLALAQEEVRLRGQVTVLLTTDAAIRELNRRFRGKNKPTDVLSFPAGAMPGAAIAGDLAISVPTAMRQAAEQGHSLSIEIKVLVLHGLLHLAGYDHEADNGKMARRELLLRARLGLPQGLIERAETSKLGVTAGCPILPRSLRKGGTAPNPKRKQSVRGASRVPPVSILRPGIPPNPRRKQAIGGAKP